MSYIGYLTYVAGLLQSLYKECQVFVKRTPKLDAIPNFIYSLSSARRTSERFSRCNKIVINSQSCTILVSSDFNKSFQFERCHFKRWQHKMLFFLTKKNIVNILKDDIVVVTIYLYKNYIVC